MPRFHHKRRHSWPYCGSGMHLRERRNLPIITVTEPADEVGKEFESQFLTPIDTEDLLEDDAASAGIIRSESTRPHRLWPQSKSKARQAEASDGTVSLRKMMQPPLDRARSLFVLPTTMSAGEAVMLPYWIYRLSAHPIAPKERGRPRADERSRLVIEKNHRRCHSERPRAWKQPSENLWTLQEE
ncbi:uncharacterized protein BDV14DRAFT_113610 [Aspergillus stella-maris]|uniref:uncharacterized protein n=1 Tax=Aspergillus stella-maris TaxID=1810926 RepID=UPI003CCD52B3